MGIEMKCDYPYLQAGDGEVMQIDNKPVVDVKNITLDQWLKLLGNKRMFVPYWEFPTDAHKNEYILTIHDRSETDFRNLTRCFLIETGFLGRDSDGVMFRLELRRDLQLEFDRRFLAGQKPWEGITWILDLLPHHPEEALGVLKSYFYAHAQLLPDGRITGLWDAMSLIRARYLSVPQTSDEISKMMLSLNPREFEILIARLYEKMGYSVDITPYSKDDGADVICRHDSPGRRELLIVQCKRYSHNVGLAHFRDLLGTVTDRKATKGVLVTPGGFTKKAIEKSTSNPKIELLGGEELQQLLVQNLGANWINNLDRLTLEGSPKQS
jgi:restriction system protein